MSTILIIDDDPSLGRVLKHFLEHEGYVVVLSTDLQSGRDVLINKTVSAVLLDLRLGADSGLDLLRELKGKKAKKEVTPPVVVMTAENTPDNAIEAMGLGAVEYLVKPFDLQQLKETLGTVLENSLEPVPQTRDVKPAAGPLVGRSAAMQEVYKRIGLYSRHQGTVLILGHSGVGKELVAQAIHKAGPIADGPFVALNMSAIPENLLESELFGHEKGSFTGAEKSHPGKFRLAEGGTIFLDEIGDMPMAVQAKLLRVLQEKEVSPVGSSQSWPVNARVIAATQVDLAKAVEEGQFRQDLYFRLNVLPIDIPSLSDRKEDIPELVAAFLKRTPRQDVEHEEAVFSTDALAVLNSYNWPGNVRELMNVVERVVLLTQKQMITAEDVYRYGGIPRDVSQVAVKPQDFPAAVEALFKPLVESLLEAGDEQGLRTSLEPVEKVIIEMALLYFRGNQIKVASFLGVNRNTLRKMIQTLGVDVAEIKSRCRRN